jgi:hypothetical protein
MYQQSLPYTLLQIRPKVTIRFSHGESLECGALESVPKPVDGVGFQPLIAFFDIFLGRCPRLV